VSKLNNIKTALIKSRVKGFLRVCINIILGWFFKNTLYFNPKKSHWGGKILILVLQIG
jgi:hypothetical protein